MTESGTSVVAVARDAAHRFSKPAADRLHLLKGIGVDGDAYAGPTVRHRSRVAIDPTQPNLRQVHLIHAELLDELADDGFVVRPGDLGENILTRGVDLLALPTGTILRFASGAAVSVTGLRNPCAQIERFQPGLLAAVLDRATDGTLIRKAGVMAVVVTSGTVAPQDAIAIIPPPPPHRALQPV
ncbi:MOSC domain-containing protein [Sphingomonas adhaesiva]|uniref:MOSC domain-containing protein n=1 Tax=Sphingomonas adhaesiva TaxID=28212 RepID=UPI002FF9A770